MEAYLERGNFSQGIGVPTIDLLVGVVLAMVAGFFAIMLVKKLVLTKKFHYFAFYTWALGIALILYAVFIL